MIFDFYFLDVRTASIFVNNCMRHPDSNYDPGHTSVLPLDKLFLGLTENHYIVNNNEKVSDSVSCYRHFSIEKSRH